MKIQDMDNFESDDDANDVWSKPFDAESPKKILALSPKIAQQRSELNNHSRVIIHIDIDCFYAQVEMIRDPSLREKPLGIQQKYIIVTSNYVARARGVTKLMLVKDALEKCPELVLVSGEDLTLYREMSYKISNYLQKYCPLVERLGFDENFLDITDLVKGKLGQGQSSEVKGHLYSKPGFDSTQADCCCGCHERLAVGSQLAADIREGLHAELGISCCAGIAHNKLLSKLVAGTHKPNQQTTIFPEQLQHLIGSLSSVRNIPGIGHSSARKLKDIGIVSIQDLQEADCSMLEDMFGAVAAETMKNLAVGIDTSPVVAFGLPQTLSDEDSFKKCSTVTAMKTRIHQLILNLLDRLLKDGRLPLTFRITIRKLANHRYANRESRQAPIPVHIFSKFSQETIPAVGKHLEELAMSLVLKMMNVSQPFHLTLINVAFTKLEQKSENAITNFFLPKPVSGKSDKDTVYIGTFPNSDITNAVCNSASSEVVQSNETEKSQLHASVCKVKTCPNETFKDSQMSAKINSDKTDAKQLYSEDYKKKSLNKSSLFKWLVKSPVKEETSSSSGDWHCDSTNQVINNINNSEGPHPPSNHSLNPGNEDRSLKRKSSDSLSDNDTSVKRVRESSCQLANTFDTFIPEGIDKEVFYELPANIQQEILTQSSTDRLTSSHGDTKHRTTVNSVSVKTSKGRTTKTCGSPRTKGNLSSYVESSNPLTSESQVVSANSSKQSIFSPVPPLPPVKENHESRLYTENCVKANSLINPYVKSSTFTYCESKLLNISKGITSTAVNMSNDLSCIGSLSVVAPQKSHNMKTQVAVLQTDNSERKHNSPLNSNHSVDKSTEDHHPEPREITPATSQRFKMSDIPPNIDRSVFITLPPDIQQEIMNEWRQKTANTVPAALHFKNPRPSSCGNILSYFPKK